jgi:flagellin-like protein
VIAMTAFPPGDQPPIQSSGPTEPRKTRRAQAAIVAILLLIAIAVVLVLLL